MRWELGTRAGLTLTLTLTPTLTPTPTLTLNPNPNQVREHNVVIDPTVMVSVMSVMVLEGWQTRLDPSVCIFDQLQVARGSGAFGMAQRAHELFMSVFGAWLS